MKYIKTFEGFLDKIKRGIFSADSNLTDSTKVIDKYNLYDEVLSRVDEFYGNMYKKSDKEKGVSKIIDIIYRHYEQQPSDEQLNAEIQRYFGIKKLSENYSPNDYDLDISLKHEQGNLLYDFWRSNHEKNYIGLASFLEEEGYEIEKDGRWKGLDGILYEFWSNNPDADNENVFSDEGLSSDFFDWLLSNGYEIKKV